MSDDTNEHFFACYLLWWSLRVSFGRPELLQAGDLTERLEDFDIRLEELVLWLMDEIVRSGPAYMVDGQKKGIASIDPKEIEQRFILSLKALESLAASFARGDESRAGAIGVGVSAGFFASFRVFSRRQIRRFHG